MIKAKYYLNQWSIEHNTLHYKLPLMLKNCILKMFCALTFKTIFTYILEEEDVLTLSLVVSFWTWTLPAKGTSCLVSQYWYLSIPRENCSGQWTNWKIVDYFPSITYGLKTLLNAYFEVHIFIPWTYFVIALLHSTIIMSGVSRLICSP